MRVRSIDSYRGFCIINIMMSHLIGGWIIFDQLWLNSIYFATLDVFGACAFIFISGISISMFYNKKMKSPTIVDITNEKKLFRNEYLIRGFIILIMSFIAMFSQAIFFSDLSWFWNWDILHSLAIAQLLGYLFLKTSKKVRMITGIYLLILNYFMFNLLASHNGEFNLFGGLFFFFYNKKMIVNNPLLPSLAIFLIGTVIGEIFHDIKQVNDINERRRMVKNRILYPSIICSSILMLIGIHFKFPSFLANRSESWYFYTLGVNILVISLLFTMEEFNVFKNKKDYKFFYYFSFYSLTIYIFHYLLGYIFFHLLDVYFFFMCYGITITLLAILLKKSHDRFGWKASIKGIIGRVSMEIAKRIEYTFANQNYLEKIN